MPSKNLKPKFPIKQIMTYFGMVFAVFLVVGLLTLMMLGYRIDANNGNLQQYAVLQFGSSPSGATVSINGATVGSKTPNKKSVPAGKYDILIWRDGYETWRKSVDVKSGTMTWLNYALLVPKKLTVESVADYESVYSSLASQDGASMIIEKRSDIPVFNLVDLSSDIIKSTILTISATIYSEPTTTGIVHTFNIEKWDSSGRYVLINHLYNEKSEWLVMDIQNVNSTKNITRLFDTSISNIEFFGTSGNIFYGLDANDIRKFDLTAGTISTPLVSNVINFQLYSESNVITYVGNGAVGTNEKVVGLFQDGDSKPSIIRTVTDAKANNLHIATARYYNENYVAVSDGARVDILSGSYPNVIGDKVSQMKVIASFEAAQAVDILTFSPTGEYVFMQSGAYFASYDLEYLKFASSTIEGSGSVLPLQWLDDNYVWSDSDSELSIREFDGVNVRTINSVLSGQAVALTNNGRYIYSINKTDSVYQLQRVKMILP